ncbi:RidA family protein [Halomonas sp. GT]|uniref:RidA family protein n=1 Tax=Halomonas sp. GT TaxID=1971364 RepID=UPI0009F57261|nr:RidA family protein [Halomonas sp. GT]
MIQPVRTDLYAAKAPLEWAVVGNGILFTTQIPIGDDGAVVEGGIEAQTRQTLDNLQHTLKSAGAGMQQLTQVLIYVTQREDLATVNRVYAEYVTAPFPNRAAIIVSGFAREEMLVEMVAYAAVSEVS